MKRNSYFRHAHLLLTIQSLLLQSMGQHRGLICTCKISVSIMRDSNSRHNTTLSATLALNAITVLPTELMMRVIICPFLSGISSPTIFLLGTPLILP